MKSSTIYLQESLDFKNNLDLQIQTIQNYIYAIKRGQINTIYFTIKTILFVIFFISSIWIFNNTSSHIIGNIILFITSITLCSINLILIIVDLLDIYFSTKNPSSEKKLFNSELTYLDLTLIQSYAYACAYNQHSKFKTNLNILCAVINKQISPSYIVIQSLNEIHESIELYKNINQIITSIKKSINNIANVDYDLSIELMSDLSEIQSLFNQNNDSFDNNLKTLKTFKWQTSLCEKYLLDCKFN